MQSAGGMAILTVELGVPYSGWPMRLGDDYEFGLNLLEPQLVARIQDWARDFSFNFDEESGWSSDDARAAHAAEGIKLQSLVAERLGPNYHIELNGLASGMRQ